MPHRRPSTEPGPATASSSSRPSGAVNSGRAKVTYSGNFSVNAIARQYQMLSGSQFMDIYNRQSYENYLKNNGLSIYKGYIATPEQIPEFVAPYSNDEILRARNTDYLDAITRLGYMHQHNLSIVGGSAKTQYLVSANYMDQAGIVKHNNASRMSFMNANIV